MNSIVVVPAEKGKFKVLHNYIQEGIEYSSQALAEKEAEALRARYTEKPNKKS